MPSHNREFGSKQNGWDEVRPEKPVQARCTAPQCQWTCEGTGYRRIAELLEQHRQEHAKQGEQAHFTLEGEEQDKQRVRDQLRANLTPAPPSPPRQPRFQFKLGPLIPWLIAVLVAASFLAYWLFNAAAHPQEERPTLRQEQGEKAGIPEAAQETPAAKATPTSTPIWQEWLGQQIATGRCPNPGQVMLYDSERRKPPYSADFYCLAPTPTPDAVATRVAATVAAIPSPTRGPTAMPRPTRRPTTTPWTVQSTPTMQQMVEWDPGTNHASDMCWRNGGEFEIYDIRQRADRGWSWQYRCNSPPEEELRRLTEGLSEQELLKCGLGIAAAVSTSDWLSIIACLDLFIE